MGDATMTETTDAQQAEFEARMGRAIVRGVLVGLPLAFVLLTGALVLFADRDLAGAAVTAILPTALLGVFGGGFAGVALTMD
jgi:hypothetical protein